MRRLLIQYVLPLILCLVPPLAALLVVFAAPDKARTFYLNHLRESPIDWIILGLGLPLFAVQILLSWSALRWEGSGFNERPDRWLTHLAQASEWFPMLGLIGTVMGILETFSEITANDAIQPREIVRAYAPAITATGSGLVMALINLFPTWVVLLGRDLILSLGGGPVPPPGGAAMIERPRRSVTRFFIPLIDVMILLFCMFLLMPIFRQAETEAPKAGGKADAHAGQPTRADVESWRKEIDELRKKLAQPPKLALRVFEVDPKDGRLFYYEEGRPPKRRYVDTEGETRDLIDRHQAQLVKQYPEPAARPKVHYLLLMPRADSAFPQERQLTAYRKWFEGTSFGIDRPGNPQ